MLIAFALLLGILVSTLQGNLRFLLTASSVEELRNTVTLNADGAAQEELEWEMQNRSFAPLTEFPLSNGGSVSETTSIPARILPTPTPSVGNWRYAVNRPGQTTGI